MPRFIEHEHDHDGVDRRGFLECMAWAGTGMLWTLHGGVLASSALRRAGPGSPGAAPGSLFFVQISDSHIGFDKAANSDVTATLKQAIDRINALPAAPAFLIHTGDISHLSHGDEFDTARQVIGTARTGTGRAFFVPGEHDVLGDNGSSYRGLFGRGTRGDGWYSFDTHGVHFVGLVNVQNLQAGGLGRLGAEQLEWLEKDLAPLSNSTPIVVFAHIPLWTIYAAWGWGTDDAAQALTYLRRFGSVTVLNGHIHQTLQKIEGDITFHTALSTAFPQPHPGTAPAPGPMNVGAERLRSFLGLTSVRFAQGTHALGLVDASLAGAVASDWTPAPRSASAATGTAHDSGAARAVAGEIVIDNFTFQPPAVTVRAGTPIVWVNRD